ncbi:hypothetical protein Tco_0491407 [Tanacetum coccineum]
MPPRRSSATARAVATVAARAAAAAAAAAATPMTAAAIEQLIEARVSVALANHETLRNSTNGHGDGSHNSKTGIRGTVRTPRECTYKDFLNCKPLTFKGTEGVVVLSQWFEKKESVFHISNCAVENQVKFATYTFFGNALTWWNSHMKTVTQDVAYAMDYKALKKMITINTTRSISALGCSDNWGHSIGKEFVVMSFATSAVTYTSVYTDSEPGRAFWEADDEEISEGGIPRVIVLGYDGLLIQPVAPPSSDYIPGPEDPQTPPVPQDEDEREPMFVQAHDPDYVPEPIYPEYIPLEDEHEFPAEEQPLPPVDSPTAELPRYVTKSDP